MTTRSIAIIAFTLLLMGTTLGLAGTDLVLPAVPSLPGALGGSPALAQLVLAAFVAGAGLGLVAFGELGARFDPRLLLIGSLAAYASISALCALAPTLELLVALRFLQGLTGAAAAVFAPGMIRQLFEERSAVRAIGLLASVESLVPALAPIAGVWLLHAFGWQGNFLTLAVLAGAVAIAVLVLKDRLPEPQARSLTGGYGRLLADPVYLRYALSHAATLGALLTFVFGAPAVITGPLEGTLADFVTMQVTGIAFFILGANLAGWLADRFGPETMILAGSALSALGALAILAYAVAGGREPLVIVALFVPMNLGLGFRGPPGFYKAVVASRGDDARGAGLLLLIVLLVAAGGTAAAAPFITQGLAPLALAAAAVSGLSVVLLVALPRLEAEAGGA